jgi:hypothetical protein
MSVVLQQQSTTLSAEAARPGAAGDFLPSVMLFAQRSAAGAGGHRAGKRR